jgi:hypothetical protein
VDRVRTNLLQVCYLENQYHVQTTSILPLKIHFVILWKYKKRRVVEVFSWQNWWKTVLRNLFKELQIQKYQVVLYFFWKICLFTTSLFFTTKSSHLTSSPNRQMSFNINFWQMNFARLLPHRNEEESLLHFLLFFLF